VSLQQTTHTGNESISYKLKTEKPKLCECRPAAENNSQTNNIVWCEAWFMWKSNMKRQYLHVQSLVRNRTTSSLVLLLSQIWMLILETHFSAGSEIPRTHSGLEPAIQGTMSPASSVPCPWSPSMQYANLNSENAVSTESPLWWWAAGKSHA